MIQLPNYNLLRYELGIVKLHKNMTTLQYFEEFHSKYNNYRPELFDWYQTLSKEQLQNLDIVKSVITEQHRYNHNKLKTVYFNLKYLNYAINISTRTVIFEVYHTFLGPDDIHTVYNVRANS